MVDIPTDPIIHDCVCICIQGMNVSTKRKDNKTVMGHNRHYNRKRDITRSLEFGSEMSLRMENNRMKRENNKMMFPNEEGQDK